MDIINLKPETPTSAMPQVYKATLFQTATINTVTSSPVTYNITRFDTHHGFQVDVDVITGNVTASTTMTSEWTTDVTDSPLLIRSCTETILLTIVLIIIVLSTIAGNFLVIASIITNVHLRTTTNYFIANLAVADLLLGTTVLPFSATLEVLQYWVFGQIFCNIWAAIDVLCCTASILSLCVISIDRYIGVTRPLQHAAIVQHSRALFVILCVWLLSGIISVAPLIGWKEAPDPNPRICTVTTHTGYVLFSSSLSFYIPCLIILVVYFRIYSETVKYTKCIAAGGKMTKVDEENRVALRIHTGKSSSSSAITTTTEPHKSSSVSPRASQKRYSALMYQQQNHERPALRTSHSNDYGNGKRSDASNSVKGSSRRSLIAPSSGYQTVDRNGRKRSACPTGNRVTFSNRVAKFKREKKAAKTLGIVVGVFITCWLPFFFLLPLQSLCQSCKIPAIVFKLFFWLGYCNSTMNPVIYTCYSTEFRRAFQDILCCRKLCRRRTAVVVLTKVKHKDKSQTRSSSTKSDRKKTSKMSYELTLSQISNGASNLSTSHLSYGLSNSVTSSSFHHDDSLDVCGDTKRTSCYTPFDHNSSTETFLTFLCQECKSLCPGNGHLESPSRALIHSCKLFPQDTNGSIPPSTGSPLPDFNRVQCICCKHFQSKDQMLRWPERDTGQEKVPSSCEISMASLSCHSSSPVSSS